MATTSEAFAMAVHHHQAGRLQAAEQIYGQILAVESNHADAWHLLGMAHYQRGNHQVATDHIGRAIRLNPNAPAFHCNLGNVYQALKKQDEAVASYRRALELNPDYAEAYNNLANALQAQGKQDDAVTCYRRALELNPDYAEPYYNLGNAFNEQGKQDDAVTCFRRALELKPDYAEAHNNLANVLQAQGKLDDAVTCYRRALELKPDSAKAYYNLGYVFNEQGKLDDAVTCYRKALELKPDYAEAYNNLGNVFEDQGKQDDAVTCYRRALELKPDSAEAYNNLGNVFKEQGKHDDAVTCYRRALELSPDHAGAHGNLAAAFMALGRLDEAILHHRKAVQLDPASAVSHGNLLYTLNYHSGYDAATLFAEHRAWGERHADSLTAASPPHANDRSPSRRLRVGYVSPHFKSHAVNFFSEPILASHDHSRYEIFCYSDVELPDETTRRLRGYADQWREIAWQSDPRVAEQIRADQIDILIDLTGHISGGKRLLVFARRPAPIQVTYLGYQNTTGMLAMDYRLTDEYSDPPGLTERWYTETLVRLPKTFFCYLPSSDAPPIVTVPALAQGYITFGSINSFAKVTPEVLATWADLLLRVPNSRLLVRADMPLSLQKHLRQTFAAHGVASERLELVNRLPHRQYLELINRLDIAVDPFPFNGHTTTCDCLWQGVPIVTLSGNTYVSRFGGSALATLGLGELIAGNKEQYVDIAARLAGDLQQLQTLRSTLRQRMSDSPLLDFQTFTRNLEAEYRQMWRSWLQIGS